MRHKLLKFSALLFFGIGGVCLHAQEAISAAGGNADGSGGSVSYTVGQVVYTSISDANTSVSQGVQQAFEIIVQTQIEEAKDINLSVSVYPNPTVDNLSLSFKDFDLTEVKYQLYDISGQLMQSDKIVSNHTDISTASLVPATYFLQILQSNKTVKTFKIIKSK